MASGSCRFSASLRSNWRVGDGVEKAFEAPCLHRIPPVESSTRFHQSRGTRRGDCHRRKGRHCRCSPRPARTCGGRKVGGYAHRRPPAVGARPPPMEDCDGMARPRKVINDARANKPGAGDDKDAHGFFRSEPCVGQITDLSHTDAFPTDTS